MSLKRKFLLRNWGLVFGLLLVGAASLWGLEGLRRQVRVTLHAYDDLALLQDAARRISLAHQAIDQPKPDRTKARSMIQRAIDALATFIDHEKVNYNVQYAIDGLALLKQTQDQAATLPPAEASAALDRAGASLASASVACQRFIEAKDKAAGQHLQITMIVIATIFGLTLLASAQSSLMQYRSVMLPLQRLREGVRRVAAAQFSGTVEESGESEFVELAVEFNQMASELESFYRQLEEKVNATSRELVRSERLASVGFLAAGVAHEINNPLNIISGYAELAYRRLASHSDQAALDDAKEVLRVIRDESFRCKEITGRLLSLAKGGSDDRKPLELDAVARDVAVLAKGLRDYRDRQIELKLDGPLNVIANLTEMKQVLLNLTVNALQAVEPGKGKVTIEGRRRKNGWVEVSVCDNGYGIAPDTLKHVFEPFYSRRPGLRAPGTGLGLSITHAIVENHGGRIRAESGGVGHGSRFTVELPSNKGVLK